MNKHNWRTKTQQNGRMMNVSDNFFELINTFLIIFLFLSTKLVWLVCCYCTSNVIVLMFNVLTRQYLHMNCNFHGFYAFIFSFRVFTENRINYDLRLGNGSNDPREIQSNSFIIETMRKMNIKITDLSTNSFNLFLIHFIGLAIWSISKKPFPPFENFCQNRIESAHSNMITRHVSITHHQNWKYN